MKLVPSNRVVIADVDKTQTKINSLIKDGPSNLQFIVDFDNTLTKTHKDGVSLDCSWGVLESYRELPSSYHDRVRAAKEKYHPIELDVSISQEEKIPIMIEWYKEANRCLAESGVKLPWLPLMVEQSNVELRDLTEEMLRSLHTNNIPLLVLSAGVGDLINHIMQHFGVLHDNTTLVSNFLKFDEEGNIVGLQGLTRFINYSFVFCLTFPDSGEESDLIHMYNKAESIRKRSSEESCKRRNVIVLGDSLGDVHMAAGVKDPSVVLTVGFLNHNIQSSLETYKSQFDIVLLDDQTMSFPHSLLAEILSSSQ